MSHAFLADAMNKSRYRNQVWYQTRIQDVLGDLKEKRVRGVDATLRIADELIKALSLPVEKTVPVPPRELVPIADENLMMPVETEVLDILYKSTEKGGDERYLNARNKKSPDEKYYFRATTTWDYGWQQKLSRLRARDVNFGKKAILKETFYRKNNLGPDPIYYAEPSGGTISICSEYSCSV